MNAIPATPAALSELLKARITAETELRRMRRINHAFRNGRRAFLRRGFAEADFQKFTEIIKRNPEYGPAPFSPRLLFAKMAQIERFDKEIEIGKRLLTPAKAG